jgi:DNA invertase Pin-like site-specific DNA recombinase
MSHAMTVALYITDKHNCADMIQSLRRHAQDNGWAVTEYREDKLGRRSDRPMLKRCLAEAKAGRIEGLLVGSVRCLGESAAKIMATLADLTGHGVCVRSMQEPAIDTFAEYGNAVVGVINAFMSLQSSIRSERIREGMAFSRSRNIHCGRRKLNLDVEWIKSMRQAGASLRQIADAQHPKVSIPTIVRILNAQAA